MNDRDFMRYSRQILLDDIALDGQQKLLDSRADYWSWRAGYTCCAIPVGLASGRWYWQMTTMCI